MLEFVVSGGNVIQITPAVSFASIEDALIKCVGKFRWSMPGLTSRDGILVEPIYRHFLKYRLSVSVKVRTDKLSVIGYRLWPYIGSEYRLNFGDFTPDI